MKVVTKTVDSQEEGLEQVCILLGETLINGALSIKVTELCSKLLQEKGIYAKDSKAVFLYTMPNGVSTGDIKSIAKDWLAPELFAKVKDMKEFDIYGLLKYFVNQIDKITAEIIEE